MFRMFKRSQETQRSALFDAYESFNRALRIARAARGEPIGSVERSVWKAQRWVGDRRRTWASGLLLGLGVVFGAMFVRRISGGGIRPSEAQGGGVAA